MSSSTLSPTRPAEAATVTRTPRGWAFTGVAAGSRRHRRHRGLDADRRRLRPRGRRRPRRHRRPPRRARPADPRLPHGDDALGRPALVFAAGLRRRLADQLPTAASSPTSPPAASASSPSPGSSGRASRPSSSSASPTRASGSCPSRAVFFNHWVGTIPWLWVGAGVTGVAVAVAALRHGACRAWLGWVGARPRRAHPAARHLAAAVHGRHDRSGLAARHRPGPGARVTAPRALARSEKSRRSPRVDRRYGAVTMTTERRPPRAGLPRAAAAIAATAWGTAVLAVVLVVVARPPLGEGLWFFVVDVAVAVRLRHGGGARPRRAGPTRRLAPRPRRRRWRGRGPRASATRRWPQQRPGLPGADVVAVAPEHRLGPGHAGPLPRRPVARAGPPARPGRWGVAAGAALVVGVLAAQLARGVRRLHRPARRRGRRRARRRRGGRAPPPPRPGRRAQRARLARPRRRAARAVVRPARLLPVRLGAAARSGRPRCCTCCRRPSTRPRSSSPCCAAGCGACGSP